MHTEVNSALTVVLITLSNEEFSKVGLSNVPAAQTIYCVGILRRSTRILNQML